MNDRGPDPHATRVHAAPMGKADPPWLPWVAYNALAVPVTIAAFHLGRFFDDKIREGAEGRRRLFTRLAHEREHLRGCVWVHAASAGEYEQARPVLRALRERTGGRVPTLLTVFSPSGHARASAHPETDVVEYLPLDSMPAMERMLALLRPSALVFVKYDAWPNLVWSARRRGIPTLLLGASLHPRSQRLRPVARDFFGSVYDRFDAIGTIAERDARAFVESLHVEPSRVRVVGDTRVDQIVDRLARAENATLTRTLAQAGLRWCVLGSTWPADEEIVLGPALDAVRTRAQAGADVGVIVAPHEPTPEHLERIERAATEAGLVAARLSELVDLRSGTRRSGPIADDAERWRVVIVDTVGVLAEIYRVGISAYVGGAFTTGVHSVLEPAACGLPVHFGPRHANAVEAAALVEAGAARVVLDRGAARRLFDEAFDDPTRTRERGAIAARFVREHTGATERSLDLVWSHLPPGVRGDSARGDHGA